MAYPRHWLLTIHGSFQSYNAGEIWSINIRGVPGVTRDYGAEDAALTDMKSAVQTWFGTPGNRIRSDAQLEGLKLNEIGPDGKYAHPVTHQVAYGAGVTGGDPPLWPTFVCVVWSWSTAAARGPGSKGRVYPPNTPGSATTGHTTIDSTEQGHQKDSAKALLSAISNPGGGNFPFAPRVVSKVGAAINVINGVRVGSVLDVQRRRKDQFVETYVSAAWP